MQQAGVVVKCNTMKSQPNRDYKSDDVVQTPRPLAKAIVEHFKPTGAILEPCKGEGNFLAELPYGTAWCEISEGSDFFKWVAGCNWIVTNPPWSKFREFLKHSMEVADEIVFLVTVNHLWTKARLRDIEEAGFGIKEICKVRTPLGFPASGFQLGAIHLSRGWTGLMTCGTIEWEDSPEDVAEMQRRKAARREAARVRREAKKAEAARIKRLEAERDVRIRQIEEARRQAAGDMVGALEAVEPVGQ